jgi:23S rRNA (adenine2503-C2)-methyltransferase
VQSLRAVEKVMSDDDTVKTVWQTPDKLHIESVLIPEENRLTLCISSQAGCPIGCGFCATGLYGFHRSLTAGEIFDQYLLTAGTLVKGTKITNLVFMGMGEPFLNYENVIKACDILTSQLGAGLSAKKITISTVGLVKGIYRLADEDPRFKLAVSLHSAVEENRQKLIPVAQKNPLSSLKEACRYYAEKSGARITFEYLLIKNINDNPAEAKALATFVRNIPCKVNLIIYNEIEGVDYRRPDEPTVAAFRDYLYPRAPAVTVRKSRGADIRAACGQLAGKKNN